MLTIAELNHIHRCVNTAYKAASRSARNPSISAELAAGFRSEAHVLREIVNTLETMIQEVSK